MPVYKSFFNNLTSVVNNLDTVVVKAAIGDSINNHRALTVNQVIRYLNTRRSRQLRNLGIELSATYNLLRGDIVSSRHNLRTDAIDINEFVNFYQGTVVNGFGLRTLTNGVNRGTIGRTISAAV